MLEFKKPRLDYGKLLSPPLGYVLENAVATTYSLDMLAFLSIPVALFYSQSLDEKVSEDRMDIFDAIQKTSDKVKIYCQKSKIARPDNNMLISFIEDSVAEMLPDKANISFHPKIWVIRYRGKDKSILYRVIVLSRNLTFDRSWDVAFFLEGFLGNSIKVKNKPLADYLNHLSGISDFRDSQKFIKDFQKVDFIVENPFNGFSFHPMGFDAYTNPLQDETFEDLIIVSPFLNKTTLNHFSNKKIVSGEKYLFSRKEELDKIHLDVLGDYAVYALSQRVVDGEDDVEVSEEAGEDSQTQNLHAKLFIGSKANNKTRWFLGSANCSNAAMTRNEEFLISLEADDNLAAPQEILKILLGKETMLEIFEKYERSSRDPIESTEIDFREIIFSLLQYLESKKNITAICKPDSEPTNKFTIQIAIIHNELFDTQEFEISCSPYGWKSDLRVISPGVSLDFAGMALHNLSPFLIWNILHKPSGQNKEFITRIPIKLPDNRKQAIFRSIIENKEKFFQFIQFLLGNNEGQFKFIGSKSNYSPKKGSGSNSIWNQSQPLLEEMLMALSRNPGKLADIDKVIAQLQNAGADDIIPEDFIKFWKVFQTALNNG